MTVVIIMSAHLDVEDFTADTISVTFLAASTMACATFAITDDSRIENTESFEVTFDISDSRIIAPQQNPMVTIQDDDNRKCFLYQT